MFLPTLSSRLGFRNAYHTICWVVFGGALVAFSLTRLRYLDFDGVFRSAALPGEFFYFSRPGLARLGMIVHLYCILPVSILVVAQFIPLIRQKVLVFHRVNGYVCLILGLLGAFASLPSFRRAFGGDPAAQMAHTVLLSLFTWANIMGYRSVKRNKLGDHRAWMLRAWCWAGAIITIRIILFTSAITASVTGGYYMAQPCDKIDFVLGGRNNTLKRYPGCASFYSGANVRQHVVVEADVANFDADVMQLIAAFNMTYPMSAWIAIALHVVGAEIYLFYDKRSYKCLGPSRNEPSEEKKSIRTTVG